MPQDADSDRRLAEFVRLLTAGQRALYTYIRGLIWNRADANDVLQSTNEVLWTKREEFTPGSNFDAWANRVAYFEVLAFRKRRHADRHLFDDELLGDMSDAVVESSTHADQRQIYLDECLDQLADEHRDTIKQRYEPGTTIADLAKQQDRSVQAISQLLYRIRTQLMKCIEEKLAAEGES